MNDNKKEKSSKFDVLTKFKQLEKNWFLQNFKVVNKILQIIIYCKKKLQNH